MRTFFIILLFLFSLQAPAQSFDIMLGNINVSQQKNISLKEVLKDPKVVCLDTTQKITSYNVSLYINERLEVEGPFLVKGEQFSAEVIDMLKRNQHNSGKLFIDEIKVIGPDKRIRNWASIELKFP